MRVRSCAGMQERMQPGTATSVEGLIDAVVRGELDEAHALRLCTECPELVTLALLAAGKRIAEQGKMIAGLQAHHEGPAASPSTPSGMRPIYSKPNTSKRR